MRQYTHWPGNLGIEKEILIEEADPSSAEIAQIMGRNSPGLWVSRAA
jgi:hypothetical protein